MTPRATRLVVEDVTTQNVLATFIGSFLFSLVGIIALNMGAYGGVRLENGIYGHSRFCNTDFDDKLACLNLSGV